MQENLLRLLNHSENKLTNVTKRFLVKRSSQIDKLILHFDKNQTKFPSLQLKPEKKSLMIKRQIPSSKKLQPLIFKVKRSLTCERDCRYQPEILLGPWEQ
ncbi:hypothetical protein pb186bvf_011588 [Paramecium bursaria]